MKTNKIQEAQKLLAMTEQEFFTESVIFLSQKIFELVDGTTSTEEFQKCKGVVDGVSKIREMHKVLPKYPEKGWLLPYLIEGDKVFGSNRWEWWSLCLLERKITGTIPHINFRTSAYEEGVKETVSHIEKILRNIESVESVETRSSWMTFVEWLLWGFGSHRVKEMRWSENVGEILYKEFQLGRMQQYPFDYMANFSQELKKGSNRWSNPTAFFQTPPSIGRMMIKIILKDETDITKSVYDPCAGTGTMLLEASNYSVNLYAQEILWDLCLMLEVNSYLYIPWLVHPAPFLKMKKPTTNCSKDR